MRAPWVDNVGLVVKTQAARKTLQGTFRIVTTMSGVGKPSQINHPATLTIQARQSLKGRIPHCRTGGSR